VAEGHDCRALAAPRTPAKGTASLSGCQWLGKYSALNAPLEYLARLSSLPPPRSDGEGENMPYTPSTANRGVYFVSVYAVDLRIYASVHIDAYAWGQP
jgi:hypothetical protein